MLNYRLVAVLIFLSSVVVPLASRWAVEPHGSWFRPFVVWALIVFRRLYTPAPQEIK